MSNIINMKNIRALIILPALFALAGCSILSTPSPVATNTTVAAKQVVDFNDNATGIHFQYSSDLQPTTSTEAPAPLLYVELKKQQAAGTVSGGISVRVLTSLWEKQALDRYLSGELKHYIGATADADQDNPNFWKQEFSRSTRSDGTLVITFQGSEKNGSTTFIVSSGQYVEVSSGWQAGKTDLSNYHNQIVQSLAW